MEKIVKGIIEKIEFFKIEDKTLEELKADTLSELKVKNTSDNSNLWGCIKALAEYMENYTM